MIGGRLAGLAKAASLGMLLVASLLLAAGSANASEVVYNNFNTVPAMVNMHPDTDTYSLDFEYFPFGGMVEIPRTRDSVLKAISIQVDSFTCEAGVYSLENCYSQRERKKFRFALTASVYKVGAGDEPEATPIATSTETFKIPYRPTTNVSCPQTVEGKGYGPNCDVGGYLATVEFKHFSSAVVLPDRFIVLISTPESLEHEETTVVNVGLQSAYKEFALGEFVSEPPADGGVPTIGSYPFPKAAYIRGKFSEEEGGFEGFQPVFEVITRS